MPSSLLQSEHVSQEAEALTAKKSTDRAFELDFLRGIAIVMMVFMHFSYDVRYEFGMDAFEYLHSPWFWTFVHPIILVLFVGLSGICCTFSKNNLKRGLRLLAVALTFTIVTYFITEYVGVYCLIIFNVLHVLSISTLIYALIALIEQKAKIKAEQITFILLLIGCWVMMLINNISMYDSEDTSVIMYAFGVDVSGVPPTADYMALVPWMGVFLACAAGGRILYKEKKTLFAGAGKKVRAVTRPLEFLGRHSLLIYLVHQPLVYGILYIIFLIAGKV